MFSRRSFFTFAAVTASFLIPAQFAAAQDVPRIATVNPAKIFNEMQETKDLKQKMQNDAQVTQAEGTKLKADLEDAQKRRELFNPGSEDLKKANREVLEKAMTFQVWQELKKAEIGRQQKDQMKALFNKIEDATKEIADAKKLDLVIVEQKVEFPADMDQINVDQLRLLINQRTVMFNNGKLDITNEVLAAVDAKYKTRK